jgi:hypothetical protein
MCRLVDFEPFTALSTFDLLTISKSCQSTLFVRRQANQGDFKPHSVLRVLTGVPSAEPAK